MHLLHFSFFVVSSLLVKGNARPVQAEADDLARELNELADYLEDEIDTLGGDGNLQAAKRRSEFDEEKRKAYFPSPAGSRELTEKRSHWMNEKRAASPPPTSPLPASPLPTSPLPASPLPASSPTPTQSSVVEARKLFLGTTCTDANRILKLKKPPLRRQTRLFGSGVYLSGDMQVAEGIARRLAQRVKGEPCLLDVRAKLGLIYTLPNDLDPKSDTYKLVTRFWWPSFNTAVVMGTNQLSGNNTLPIIKIACVRNPLRIEALSQIKLSKMPAK